MKVKSNTNKLDSLWKGICFLKIIEEEKVIMQLTRTRLDAKEVNTLARNSTHSGNSSMSYVNDIHHGDNISICSNQSFH